MAAGFHDANPKHQVLQIADEYERMATQAATLEIQLQELAASKLKHER